MNRCGQCSATRPMNVLCALCERCHLGVLDRNGSCQARRQKKCGRQLLDLEGPFGVAQTHLCYLPPDTTRLYAMLHTDSFPDQVYIYGVYFRIQRRSAILWKLYKNLFEIYLKIVVSFWDSSRYLRNFLCFCPRMLICFSIFYFYSQFF